LYQIPTAFVPSSNHLPTTFTPPSNHLQHLQAGASNGLPKIFQWLSNDLPKALQQSSTDIPMVSIDVPMNGWFPFPTAPSMSAETGTSLTFGPRNLPSQADAETPTH
jgi:hypothetical protein